MFNEEEVDAKGKFTYIRSSIETTPFPDNHFDFIICHSVIFYLEDVESGIREFYRILKPGGILFLTAHTKFSLFTLWRIIKRDGLHLKSVKHLEGIRFYSANYYKGILEKHGFNILLQDGYRLVYPLHRRFVKALHKFLNISLFSIFKPYKNSGLMGKIKSEIAYHSVFIAKK